MEYVVILHRGKAAFIGWFSGRARGDLAGESILEVTSQVTDTRMLHIRRLTSSYHLVKAGIIGVNGLFHFE